MSRNTAASSREFAERFREAIRRRVHPNTAIHLKQLGGIAGYSRDSFMRWWRGEARMPADAVNALVTFFDGAGDSAFLHEVFGREAAALDAELDALKRRLADLEHRHATTSDRVRTVDAAAPAAAGRAVRDESRGVGAADPAAEGGVRGE